MSLSPEILLDRAIQERVATALETQPSEDGGDAFTVTYIFPGVDFGAGWTEDIQSPAGLRGKVVGVSIYDVTEAFVGSTTESRLDVGIQGGDANAYSEGLDLGTTAIDAAASFDTPVGVVGTIPAGDDILVTGVVSVGSPAGIATCALTIRYFV